MTFDVSLGTGIAAALILAGLALVAAAAWHIRWATRLRTIGAQLAQLRPLDAAQWPLQAATLLQRAGVQALQWQGEWLGQAIHGAWGHAGDNPHWSVTLAEADGDIHVELRAQWRHARAEAAWLATLACEWFVLHWRALAREQAAQLDAALRQRAQQTLTLLHDVRNFAQWALWTAEAFEAAVPDEAQLVQQARQLAQSAPLVRTRAHALLARTRGYDSAAVSQAPADLPALLHNIASLHGLRLVNEGTACSTTPLAVWLTILDNLVVNAVQHRHPEQPAPLAHWEAAARGDATIARLTLTLPGARVDGDPATWFVPMVSARVDGSGLGLYLARRAARQAGGDLRAHALPLVFVVELP